MFSAIESYAKEKQISVVFDLSASAPMTSGAIIWCDSSLDITGEIAKRYDASKPTPK